MAATAPKGMKVVAYKQSLGLQYDLKELSFSKLTRIEKIRWWEWCVYVCVCM